MSQPKRRSLRQILEGIADSGHRRGEVLRAFALLSACALAPRIAQPEHPMGSVSVREDEYLAEIARWKPEHAHLFAEAFAGLIDDMEARPYTDPFGDLHQEWRADIDRKSGGEFYTPPELCRMLARMTVPTEYPEDRPLSVLEPACGVGGMILAAAEALTERGVSPLCMQATCIDVDRAACDMCFVNLTLWGIPATIVHGNALSNETWGVWRNPLWPLARPAGRSHPQEVLAGLRGLVDAALAMENAPETVVATAAAVPVAPDVTFRADEKGQYGLFDMEVPGAA